MASRTSFIIDELEPFLLCVGSHAVADRLAEGAIFPQQRDPQVGGRFAEFAGELLDHDVDSRLAIPIRRRADLECILEAAFGDDVGGARGFPVEDAMALGGLADGNRELRYPRAEGDLHALLGDEPLGLADRGCRRRDIGEQEVDLAPVHSAALVDQIACDLHRREILDAVLGRRAGHRLQDTDPDRLLGAGSCKAREQRKTRCGQGRQFERSLHDHLR